MDNSIKTIKGYDLFEVISAFQKSIRRGIEADAMFWGVELYESGYVKFAWKRMVVMSTEDIGLADPMAPVIINALHSQYEELSKNFDKKKQYRLPYVQAILYLTHAKKSRHTDWALNYWFDSHLGNEQDRPIPDYALDIHTRRGKMMGKTIEDFFTEGSIVKNNKEMEYEQFYKEECHKRWTNKQWCQKANAEKARREAAQSKSNANSTGDSSDGILVQGSLF